MKRRPDNDIRRHKRQRRRRHLAGEGQTYQVEDDGTVALPLIDISRCGPYPGRSRKESGRLYRQNVLVNPIIDLKIVNLKVTILAKSGYRETIRW